jgi:aryl-phospho-beta-D-glucosidase BglC (GH1 family)
MPKILLVISILSISWILNAQMKKNSNLKENYKTANEIVTEMKSGWNLGNSLDSQGSETAWGNPRTTKEMISEVIKKGYKTIRVPVRWDNYYSDRYNYIISNDYFNRVEEVVKYSYSQNIYTILNVHHNEIQELFTPQNKDRVKRELSALWKQIANRFKNYNQYLIFEIINEPRDHDDWTGTKSKYDVVNEVVLDSLNVIRSTGGMNSHRLVMITPYAAYKFGALTIPNDNMIAVSIHAYIPQEFSNKEHYSFTDSDKKTLKTILENIRIGLVNRNVPVIMGEFGAMNGNNYDERVKYVKEYATICHQMNVPILWWDNGVDSEYAIFNRYNKYFTYPNIASGMINVYNQNLKSTKNNQKYLILHHGQSQASNWGKAAKILTNHNQGGIFEETLIYTKGYFLMEFSAPSAYDAQLILQSYIRSSKWATINMGGYYKRNEHFFAKFYYKDMVSQFGDDFSLLDAIYVQATNSQITLYNLWYMI